MEQLDESQLAQLTLSQTIQARTRGMCDYGHRYGSDFCVQQWHIYCARISWCHALLCEVRARKGAWIVLTAFSPIQTVWIRNTRSLSVCVCVCVCVCDSAFLAFFHTTVYKGPPRGTFSYQKQNSPDSWQPVVCGQLLLVM